jgi:pectin methylesterase-like acyl-CoA thioesterase
MNLRKKQLTKWFCFVALFAAAGLLWSPDAKGADMTISSLSPANAASGVCVDTHLWITFDTAPILAADSNMYLQICRLSDDNVVYELDLQEAYPVDGYGYNSYTTSAGLWPYHVTLGGSLTLNYVPFNISGNTLEISPSSALDYNTTYYVKMTGGFCTDASANTSPDINDNTTWRFTTKASAPAADEDYTVALDSSGDFCTLQGAVDAVTDNDPNRTIIRIKNGTYIGLVYVNSSKDNITWLGENADQTIIAGYNRDSFNGGTDYRMLFKCLGDGFRMYNLTLHNTAPDDSGQAETIRHKGKQGIAKNCKFRSYQDTLLLEGQIYLEKCYIEGDTDFIWGYGTAYFDQCRLYLLNNNSHITQPRQEENANGFFFVDCNLTSPAGISGCDLGRMFPYPYAQVAYINCTMPTTLIIPAGWNLNGNSPDHFRLWEYKSVDPSGNLIDVNDRINPGSKQLDDANAVFWRDVNNVFSYDPWNPKEVNNPPSLAWLPNPPDGDVNVTSALLTWAAGAEASSHRLYFGPNNPPSFVAEVNETSYLLTYSADANTTYYWRVDEKNSAGTTTGDVWSFTTASPLDTTPPTPDPLTWAVEPCATGLDSIAMTATTAADISGVEYYFTNVTDANHDSGWQDSSTYTDTGLERDATYTYRVKARDKSFAHNATADSNEASETTLQYICGAEMDSDFDGDCQVTLADFAIFAEGWVEREEIEDLDNGTFDTDLSSWDLVDAGGASGTMTVTYDGSNGLPAGSAYAQADTNGLTVNNHRFYQVIPVDIGTKYKFSGKWKGSLHDPNITGSVLTRADVYMGFSTSDNPTTVTTVAYKKKFVAVGSGSNLNTSSGTWDWEDITDSPLNGPTDGMFTADKPYMVVGFNLGGNANNGAVWMSLDNISIVECTSTADLNGDCVFDFDDLKMFTDEWMTCDRSPSDQCWQ